jgi:hypothetical protein
MSKLTRPAAVSLAAMSAATLCALAAQPAEAQPTGPARAHTNEHVLLISVDGMHQSDLDWYIASRPKFDTCHAAGSLAREALPVRPARLTARSAARLRAALSRVQGTDRLGRSWATLANWPGGAISSSVTRGVDQ